MKVREQASGGGRVAGTAELAKGLESIKIFIAKKDIPKRKRT